MKQFYLFVILLVCSLTISAQKQFRIKGYNQDKVNPELFDVNKFGNWTAYWITVPDEPTSTYGVYHFRKTIDLSNVPDEFIVHVSADNRYKLYVNGKFVSLGSARSHIYNWNFETIDLSPYLKTGKNTLAAIVWNFDEVRAVPQMSLNKTGFMMQGNTSKEEAVNTNESWACTKNEAYSPLGNKITEYYCTGPGDSIQASRYLWGWEQPDYNDSAWKKAKEIVQARIKGATWNDSWALVPSPIPAMEMKNERLASVRISEGIKTPSGFPAKKSSVTIPAHSSVRILLDNNQLTTGYPTLEFSKGKDAIITIGYAEALYTDAKKSMKGNRNEVEGKEFLGYEDKIIADGGDNRDFTPLWWRTWRYINLTVTTKDEPLVLDDIYATTSYYPLEKETAFSAPKYDNLSKILEVGWRTARLCANETYMDCPYYEQLQYWGDTRIQALITLYNTRDPYLVKNALEQGQQSMLFEGITQSRFPTATSQFIPSFSLWWICMGHDYWMYRGDEAYLKTLLSSHRSILDWYERQLNSDYSLGYIPLWFFVDWAKELNTGEPIRDKDGRSAYQDLIYLLGLNAAMDMEYAFGSSHIADHYRDIAAKIRENIQLRYWDEARGLYADTYDHRSYSQHVNSMAVLAGIVEGEEAKKVMTKTLSDKSLIQTTIYFSYYLHQAMSKAKMGNELLDNLTIWEDQLKLGLTTWAETPEPSRSDCHAWGSSPNIEFYRILLGIDSDSPGFEKILISPSLGKLKEVSGSMPHPKGTISVAYRIDRTGKLTTDITLPYETSGIFVWKNKEYDLKEGKQTLTIDL